MTERGKQGRLMRHRVRRSVMARSHATGAPRVEVRRKRMAIVCAIRGLVVICAGLMAT